MLDEPLCSPAPGFLCLLVSSIGRHFFDHLLRTSDSGWLAAGGSIGMSMAEKVVIGRGCRFSKISKSSCFRPDTGWPFSSVTMTLVCTASAEERNVGVCDAGCCDVAAGCGGAGADCCPASRT